jgi:hypothetical protein
VSPPTETVTDEAETFHPHPVNCFIGKAWYSTLKQDVFLKIRTAAGTMDLLNARALFQP